MNMTPAVKPLPSCPLCGISLIPQGPDIQGIPCDNPEERRWYSHPEASDCLLDGVGGAPHAWNRRPVEPVTQAVACKHENARKFEPSASIEGDVIAWCGDCGGVLITFGLGWQLPASPTAQEPVWQPIETAPRDGTHFYGLALNESAGFGWWNGEQVPMQTVIHYWDNPGEEGFYVSVTEKEAQEPFPATHWHPLIEPRCLGARGLR